MKTILAIDLGKFKSCFLQTGDYYRRIDFLYRENFQAELLLDFPENSKRKSCCALRGWLPGWLGI